MKRAFAAILALAVTVMCAAFAEEGTTYEEYAVGEANAISKVLVRMGADESACFTGYGSYGDGAYIFQNDDGSNVLLLSGSVKDGAGQTTGAAAVTGSADSISVLLTDITVLMAQENCPEADVRAFGEWMDEKIGAVREAMTAGETFTERYEGTVGEVIDIAVIAQDQGIQLEMLLNIYSDDEAK